jgi:two-component system, cell cycle response regulator
MKILIADDDTTSRLLCGATLKKLGHSVTAVEDGQKAWEAWQQDEYTLIVSNWMMPNIDGLELCRMIRGEAGFQYPYTYIILLTSMDSEDSYLEGMEAGADDFITKPFNEKHLAARLRVAERILGLHVKLRGEATHDRLTGIWNRAAILDYLQRELTRAGRQKFAVTVFLADLDRFKDVNDTYGHAAGDRILQEAARRMKTSLRPYDRIGRYGGEEFLIIASSCDRSEATVLAERIRRSISEVTIGWSSREIPMTVSLGFATCEKGSTDAASLIAAADEALYRAKNAGRNRVEFNLENASYQQL